MTAHQTILAALSAVTLVSSTAEAEFDQVRTKCSMMSLCVYDANDTPIGLENYNSGMTRYLSGQWYQMNYSTSLGFDVNAIFLYPKDNCAGQPYFQTGQQIGPADGLHPGGMRLNSPMPAAFDGFGAVWGPVGPSAVLDIKSFKYENICYPGCWGPTPVVAAPTVKLDTRSLPLPWKIH